MTDLDARPLAKFLAVLDTSVKVTVPEPEPAPEPEPTPDVTIEVTTPAKEDEE